VISPDGRRIAFTAIAEDGKKLWVRELDSLEAKALAGTEDANLPFWSPDSHALGFFSRNEVKVIQISGGPAKTIANEAPPQTDEVYCV
jgi:Tol biopolymer transport system component